jgi:hypothetical protein
VSDIEKIPSMRRDAKQGVPKRKSRDMAKPMAEAGKTKDAPQIVPRGLSPEPQTAEGPLLPLEMAAEPEPAPIETMEPEPQLEPELEPEPEPEHEPEHVVLADPEPEPVTELQPVAEPVPEPVMVAELEPEPVEEAEPEPEPAAEAPVDPNAPPMTMRETFARVDPAYAEFRKAAYAYPAEHMNDRIGEDGWTRKQMLSHVAAWHDLTTDRLIKAGASGQPVGLDRETDAINNAAARVAIGKSVGEVLKDVEASFARLRRQLLRMTDADLRIGESWAAAIIGGNTYGHYEEHMADLVPPAPLPGAQR